MCVQVELSNKQFPSYIEASLTLDQISMTLIYVSDYSWMNDEHNCGIT